MGVWSDEIEGSLSETKPKGVIWKAWKEQGGVRKIIYDTGSDFFLRACERELTNTPWEKVSKLGYIYPN
jgi:hypothetical protein